MKSEKDIYQEHYIASKEAFELWQHVPAPVRGELIRCFGNTLRSHKEEVAKTITKAIGKTINESRGEVQEAIDMCDFAVGLSRQLYGFTMPSERPDHRIQEVWHPLGPVGVITAFNFPVAVLAWNFCIAAVCGNSVIWKPSEQALGVAEHIKFLWNETAWSFTRDTNGTSLRDLLRVLPNEPGYGKMLAHDKNIPLISFTGSEKTGRQVASVVANRLGKSILELGGNNSAIVSDKADIDLAVKGCTFAALGTTGQRCTTLRRVFIQEKAYERFIWKMVSAYNSIKVGNPHNDKTLVGPVVSKECVLYTRQTIDDAIYQGARLMCGGHEVFFGDNFNYVYPAIMSVDTPIPIMKEERFVPVVYLCPYQTLEQAVRMCNDVPQGLSSCIFSDDVNETEYFLRNSYTGIVNVNTSTSGAEIGGAFGGEKNTGGGRESGSDAWKQYMRRTTSVINYSRYLPLAQGIKFD